MARAIPQAILEAGQNALWIWDQIHNAENMSHLEQVSIDIQSDRFEGEFYTKDKVAMRIIRQAYLGKRKQCRRSSIRTRDQEEPVNSESRADSAGKSSKRARPRPW